MVRTHSLGHGKGLSVRGREDCCTLRKSSFRRLQHGFTLVELLVVIAIIGILVAMLLPAVQAAREAARRSQCANNFKQVGLALHNFHSAQATFPIGDDTWLPGDGMTETECGEHDNLGKSRIFFGWATYILPYLEQEDLYDACHFDKWAGGDMENFPVLGNHIPSYVCPSDPQAGQWLDTGIGPSGANDPHNGPHPDDDFALTNIAGVADSEQWTCAGIWPRALSLNDGMWGDRGRQRPLRIRDVTDGTSHTLMLAEVTGGGADSRRGYTWGAMALTHTRDGINGPFSVPGGLDAPALWSRGTAGPSSYHPGGCQFLLVDGSVHFLNQEIAREALTSLTTRANGDPVPPADL